jgi:hypothetical protein
MHAVADLELGLTQELAVRFGSEQFGEAAEVGFDTLAQDLIDPVGQLGLLRGEIRVGHASPP